ncbi:hypothetical protein MBLNU459_g0407t2 [Dothideomycetes sp. NU459]
MTVIQPRYIISQCTVADSDELTRNNIPAFWADPHWRLAWRHRTLETHVSEISKRTPRNLLMDPETRRQQKAIDPETNRIVGFCRWLLPESHAKKNSDESLAWPEAIVPAVSPEEEAEFKRLADTAVFDPNTETDALLPPIQQARSEILARKPYLRLEYLAVHPDNQSKGVGTALVQSGIEQAAAMGLDIFVWSVAAGVRLYKRLGFRIEQEFHQDDSMYGGEGDYYVALMVYEQKDHRGGVS